MIRLILWLLLLVALPCAGQKPTPDWVEPMRRVHARFKGQPGTFAQFGDSITVSMAFWAPVPQERKNAPPELERALQRVNRTMRPACWREWKGPEFGSEGGQTTRWAEAHVEAWLKKLNPDLKIVAMSGWTSTQGSDYLQVAREIGATDTLQKPFDPQTLSRLLRDL